MQHQLLTVLLSWFIESVLNCAHNNLSVLSEFVNVETESYIYFSLNKCIDCVFLGDDESAVDLGVGGESKG